MPRISDHCINKNPSAIRIAQIKFAERKASGEDIEAINTAIGNVSLPMHPSMIKRMNALNSHPEFAKGIVKYTSTIGTEETNKSFLNIIASSGFVVDDLYSQITEGGSEAMELALKGTAGLIGGEDRPILLIDAAYTNYNALASRLGIKTVSLRRHLKENGKFVLPSLEEIEDLIVKHNPSLLVIIPYDNPTGHFYDHKTLVALGELAVKHDLWILSDEAYRELHYTDNDVVSVWGLIEEVIPGIINRRISIETASKVWNACGLRIGALITDNLDLHNRLLAEHTVTLCSNAIGQYIFGALASESHENLNRWYKQQRDYYSNMMIKLTNDFKETLPGVIISSPDASIYSVVDVRNIAKPGFNAMDFVLYCATKGFVESDGVKQTLLVSPMAGFYSVQEGEKNPGDTQMRIAYVETPEKMALVPKLFKELFNKYESSRQ